MYNTMYLESSNINNDSFILNKIDSSEKNEKKDVKIIDYDGKNETLIKNEYINYMTLEYMPNVKKDKDNKIKLFGKKFFENNKDNCIFVINEKEYPLSEYYTLKKNDIKNNKLEVKLIQISPLTNLSYMFHSEEDDPIYLSEIISTNNWDTSKVIDMSNLFNNCRLLKSIKGISNLDTSNVTNISNYFQIVSI